MFISSCDNCGGLIADEYVSAGMMRHANTLCECMVCEACGERFASDDTQAIDKHEKC